MLAIFSGVNYYHWFLPQKGAAFYAAFFIIPHTNTHLTEWHSFSLASKQQRQLSLGSRAPPQQRGHESSDAKRKRYVLPFTYPIRAAIVVMVSSNYSTLLSPHGIRQYFPDMIQHYCTIKPWQWGREILWIPFMQHYCYTNERVHILYSSRFDAFIAYHTFLSPVFFRVFIRRFLRAVKGEVHRGSRDRRFDSCIPPLRGIGAVIAHLERVSLVLLLRILP